MGHQAGERTMSNAPTFLPLRRQLFRRYFQPSRIVLGILPAPTPSGINVITLCFQMYCSYKPPMMAVAIQDVNKSYELARDLTEYVLAVPGPSLLEETLLCGTRSLRDMDKVATLKLDLMPSRSIAVPGLVKAIANVELVKETMVYTGDHVVIIGRVKKFGVNQEQKELPLLSVGPETLGYRVLARRGIHRIGTVET